MKKARKLGMSRMHKREIIYQEALIQGSPYNNPEAKELKCEFTDRAFVSMALH